MNRSFSVYLDLVRFVMACLVYVYHSNQRALSTQILPLSNYGHSAVIVFFVLSGFVIAFVADKKEHDWVSYSSSRIARIYSVALPALVLTVLLDAAGRVLYPALYDYPFDQLAVRLLASAALMNEWWFVSITAFSNVPYWSICYESWYYILFGILCFAPRRVAWPAAAFLLLLLGPKIALLAPVWAAGVVLYRWPLLKRLTVPVAWCLVLGSWLGILVFHALDLQGWGTRTLTAWLGATWVKELTFSQFFLTDYLLGLLVCSNFAGMRRLCEGFELPWPRVARGISVVAGYTLTLYLLHQPLFLFWAAVVRGDPTGYGYWWAVTGLVALSVLLVGYFTESRRGALRHLVQQVLTRWQQRVVGRPRVA